MAPWLSVIPLGVAIVLAMVLEEIIPGLVVGLLVGVFLLKPSALGGLDKFVATVLEVLKDPTNLKIAGFLYLFGGLVGMMEIAGGIKGFANFLEPRLKTPRAALGAIWLTLLVTFVTPTFRIVTIGPILRELKQRLRLPGLLLGFVLDVSSVPPVILLPVGTAFVGYMIAVVNTSLKDNAISADAFQVFLASIPFNFFAWLTVLIGLFVSFGPPWIRSRVGATTQADDDWRFVDRYAPKTQRATARTRQDLHELGLRQELAGVKPHPLNLVVVLLSLLVLSAALLYLYGARAGAHTFLAALVRANAVHTLLVSVLITVIGAFVFFMGRGTPFQELVYHFFNGANRLFKVVVLLILVWSLSLVSRNLGLNTFVVRELHWVPGPWIPAVFFLAGSALAYFIGSSWGTWGLLMPLGISLVVATGGPLVPTVGAVFASGTFGSLVSPLGDTTITTAALLDLEPTEHARNKLPWALGALAISAVLYAGVGYLG